MYVTKERRIRRWFEKFQSGDFNLQNGPRNRPESKHDEVKAAVEADISQTTLEVAARFNVAIPKVLYRLKQTGKVEMGSA